MKKLFFALILCTAMLCGCSAKGGEEISETDVPETSSVTVATESSVTTTTTTTTTTKETTVTKPAEEEIFLKPIPSEEPFEVMACKIIEDMAIDNEEDFPDKEAIKRAREICFADEEIQRIITEDNDYQEKYSEDLAVIRKVEAAEDIPFICGVEYDFDGDGDYEYVISLDYVPSHNVFDGAFVIYFDGDKYSILENRGNNLSAEDISVITGGNYDYNFLELKTSAGALWYSEDIYSFKNGMPEKVAFDCGEANSIHLKNNIFYCDVKRNGTYPFVLCRDGVFRQLGREKLTRGDFEARVQNGGEYLDSLAKSGETIAEIYTYGHYSYELCGEDFCYVLSLENNVFKPSRLNYIPEEMRFTDEVVYGGNVRAAQTASSCDYDIGGGYVCYTIGSGKSEILNVSKDNVITDSINLDNMWFDPDWQINFYDMDTPPYFALKVYNSIAYRTYFVIDGKITEMNWTLDGERLDTVDYTMLQCRGEGDGFVSYSAPGYEYSDTLERYRFSFANGSYTDIVGHTEKVPKPEGSAAVAGELLDKLWGLYFDILNFEQPCHTDEQNIKYYTKEDIMNALCEFCTKPVAEEFFNTVSSEFYIVDGRFYSYGEAPAWFPPLDYAEAAEEKDGVITARLFAYYSGQDIPYRICPPLYAEFVKEGGVWKISSLPKEK